jgi:hypothetical protein
VRDDLHPVEEIAEAGLGELALLIEEVALRHEEEAEVRGQRLDRLPRVGEELDGVAEHLLPGLDQLADDAGGDLSSVTSMAVSIIDRTKPLMPNP